MTHEDAEDAVQEGFLRAHQALDRFDPAQAFGAWLNRIVANAALDLARAAKERNEAQLVSAQLDLYRDTLAASLQAREATRPARQAVRGRLRRHAAWI